MEKIDIIARIKYWTSNQKITFSQEEYLWWSLSTGYLYILNIFLKIVQNGAIDFNCLGSIDGKSANTNRNNNYYIDKLDQKKPLSESTIRQYISIGIVFGALEICNDELINNKNKFFKNWILGNSKLKISNEFIECKNSEYYLRTKKNYIINKWRKISVMENSFFRKDMNKIIFNIFIFNSLYVEYQPEKFLDIVNSRRIKNKNELVTVEKIQQEFNLNKKIYFFFVDMVEFKNEK